MPGHGKSKSQAVGLTDGSVQTSHIIDEAVTSEKLADNIAISGTLDVSGRMFLDDQFILTRGKNGDATPDPAIVIFGGNNNFDFLQVSSAGISATEGILGNTKLNKNGFDFRYHGGAPSSAGQGEMGGEGTNNTMSTIAHNGEGSDRLAMNFKQNGNVVIARDLTVGGDTIILSNLPSDATNLSSGTLYRTATGHLKVA